MVSHLSDPFNISTACLDASFIQIKETPFDFNMILDYPLHDDTLNNLTLTFTDFTCDYMVCCEFNLSSYQIVDRIDDQPASELLVSNITLESEDPVVYAFTINNSALYNGQIAIKATNLKMNNSYIAPRIYLYIFESGIKPPGWEPDPGPSTFVPNFGSIETSDQEQEEELDTEDLYDDELIKGEKGHVESTGAVVKQSSGGGSVDEGDVITSFVPSLSEEE